MRITSSAVRTAAATLGRYLRANSLGAVAIVIASSGTAMAAGLASPNSVNSEAIVYHGVTRTDIAPGVIGPGKLAPGAVRGPAVAESTLNFGVIQRRVKGNCAVGQAVRSVAADGSVLCQTVGSTTAAGPAGGDLTGTYPDPTIAAGAVDSGKVADGTLTGADLANDSIGPAQLAATPGGRAVQTTIQSFPGGGPVVQLKLDGAQYATGVTFDDANDNFTVTTPGLYAVSAELLWTSDANGLRFLAINGSQGELVTDTRQAVSGYATLQSVSTVQRLKVGDVIFAQGATSSAATTDVASSGRGAVLTVTYLGDFPVNGLVRTGTKPPQRRVG